MAGHASTAFELQNRMHPLRPCIHRLRKSKMPKLKTKASAKKRFRLTGSGKVRAGAACTQHMLRRRSQKMKRNARGTMILCDADAKLVLSYMPYAK